MCYAWVGYAIAAVSAATGGYTAIQQGKTAKATAEYNAKVAENEAKETRNTATEQENAHRLKVQRLLSTQRAQLGAAGIELGTGSALQLQEDTLALGEADALRIRRAGGQQSDALKTESTLTRMAGENAMSQGYSSATGSLLSGAGRIVDTGVADKWFKNKSTLSTV